VSDTVGAGADMYTPIVVVTATIHFAFLLYLAIGGFVAVRRRVTIWIHLLAALWATASVTLHLDCPLTWLEQWARARSGMPALPSTGFIAHYIAGMWHPVRWGVLVELTVAALVAASWWMYASTARRTSQGQTGSRRSSRV
jgi:hypothetical protein